MDITIAGSTASVTFDAEELGRINIELAAFDGEVGIGQFPIPDTTGAGAAGTGLQFRVDEIATLLSNGFIIDEDWQRGPFKVGTNREYSYSIQDANALLEGFRVIRSRSAETDYARVMAFAALDGPAWDTTWVLNASTVTMPAKKYDGDQGWGDLITDVVEFTGKTLFLHDKAAGGRCLHYHLLTNGHTCGLAISDVPSAVNSVTVFAPSAPMRQRTSVDLDNDVMGRDQANRTHFSSDSGSITAHDADGLQHQALIEFEAASQSDLNVKTAAYLASQKNDRDTYTCAIGPLDATALALIRGGDLISVTSAAMGLTASTQRIAHMALSVWNGSPGLWLATLELGAPVRRRARVSSGARAVTRNEMLHTIAPLVCVGPNGLITDTFNRTPTSPGWGESTGGYTWSGAPGTARTSGSSGVLDTDTALIGDVRAHQGPVTLTGLASPFLIDITASFSSNRTLADYDAPWQAWTTANPLYSWGVVPIWIGSSSDNFVRLSLGGGPGAAATCEIQVVFSGLTINDVFATSFAGAGTLQVKQSATAMEIIYNGSTINVYSMSLGSGDDISPQFYTLGRTPEGGEPGGAPADGSTDLTAGRVDIVTQVDWVAVVGFPECVPALLQEVSGELVGIGDGTTTAYTTNNPYAAGSLRITVDDLPEPEIVEDDPSAGTFHFVDAPFITETIRAWYRGG